MCMGSVKQKGRRVGMPPYFDGLRVPFLVAEETLHPCVPSLQPWIRPVTVSGAFGGSGVSWPFPATWREHIGAQVDGAHKASQIGRTGGLIQNAGGCNGW